VKRGQRFGIVGEDSSQLFAFERVRHPCLRMADDGRKLQRLARRLGAGGKEHRACAALFVDRADHRSSFSVTSRNQPG
jgi:hypothetical protein